MFEFTSTSLQFAFACIYFVGFIIYVIAYWPKRRSISKSCRQVEVSGIYQEKWILEIKRKQESVAFVKKVGGISLVSIFATHIVVIVLFTRNTLFDLLSTLILFVGTALFVLITNWLGGAGTIASNARMHRNTEF